MYRVSWGYYHDIKRELEDFDIALAFYRFYSQTRTGAEIINPDRYDADCDGDGFYTCSDGLTEDERDQVMAS